MSQSLPACLNHPMGEGGEGSEGGCPRPTDLLRVTPQRSGSPPSGLPLSLLGDAASRSPSLLCSALRGSRVWPRCSPPLHGPQRGSPAYCTPAHLWLFLQLLPAGSLLL